MVIQRTTRNYPRPMTLRFSRCRSLDAMQRRHSSALRRTEPGRALPGQSRTMVRVINHLKFGLVVVYENRAATPDGESVLMFDSPSTRVRVRNYPDNWQAMSSDALLDLVVIDSE